MIRCGASLHAQNEIRYRFRIGDRTEQFRHALEWRGVEVLQLSMLCVVERDGTRPAADTWVTVYLCDRAPNTPSAEQLKSVEHLAYVPV